MNFSTTQNKQSGFTLIELLIVVAILGLLAAIGIPQYQGYQAQARINAARTLHTDMVKLIGAELAKCTSGATVILENSGVTGATDIPCATSTTTASIVTAFITYGNSTSDNPYGDDPAVTTDDPYIAAGTPGNGQTVIAAGGTGGNTITITTQWLGGSQSATLVRE